VPLPYQPENNDIPVQTPPTGFDALRTIAVSRIYLDNFDHITAYWVGMGMKLAQVALSYGADDLHGTIIEEHIFHMAGANLAQLQTEAEMVKAIRESAARRCNGITFLRTDQFLRTLRRRRYESATRRRAKSRCWEDNAGTGVRSQIAGVDIVTYKLRTYGPFEIREYNRTNFAFRQVV